MTSWVILQPWTFCPSHVCLSPDSQVQWAWRSKDSFHPQCRVSTFVSGGACPQPYGQKWLSSFRSVFHTKIFSGFKNKTYISINLIDNVAKLSLHFLPPIFCQVTRQIQKVLKWDVHLAIETALHLLHFHFCELVYSLFGEIIRFKVFFILTLRVRLATSKDILMLVEKILNLLWRSLLSLFEYIEKSVIKCLVLISQQIAKELF